MPVHTFPPRLALRPLCQLLIIVVLSLVMTGCIRSARPTVFTPATSTSLTLNREPTSPLFQTSAPTATEPAAGNTPTPASLLRTASPAPSARPLPPEQPVTLIPLSGPASGDNAEISGLAWYSDTLVLLPQFPSRFGVGDGALFGLKRADLIDYIDGGALGPLEPFAIPLSAPGLSRSIQGFEGFEAIAFSGEQAFLTIEARPSGMRGYLVRGEIEPDLSGLRLDTLHLAQIQPQTGITNLSDEAVLVAGQRLLTLNEANGLEVNPSPKAHLFDFFLQPQGEIPFPNLEYRLTDVTPPDKYGRFWAINYFFPGDLALLPNEDPLAEQYGVGPSHSRSLVVERLVEFGFSEAGLIRTDTPPIQLELDPSFISRNWEGIARLEKRGFLLVTDKFPSTLLAFVPYLAE